jgi:acetamidase/formamidase
MEIRILRIVPKPFGVNFNLPGKEFPTIGALAPEFPEGFVKYFNFDLKNRQTEFKPGIMIDLKPFPGTLAVASTPTKPHRVKVGQKILWRRSQPFGPGRTDPTWI